jgi:hypothetical protein
MDREQREAELRAMLTSQRGKEELLAILKRHAGIEEGNLPPFGTLLVETVLNYEYAPEAGADARVDPGTLSDPARPAHEKTEPGDAKFSQPPGQDVPGG